MNRQGPGKIEWTDYTWSPVTGCLRGCSYCYANRIAQRIYPEKFKPTFRKERLKDKDLGKVPDGSKIFVCDMGELFGDWVPTDWIESVLDVTKEYPQYIFQFLTKNPHRYEFWAGLFGDNCWLGATEDCSSIKQENRAIMQGLRFNGIKFLSCEPLLGELVGPIDNIDWIIIGEQTKRRYTPEEWEIVRKNADRLLHRAHMNKVARFVKNNLSKHFQIQEWPKTC